MMASVAAFSITIHGFLRGSKTGSRPFQQIVECRQSSGFQSTVISSFEYFFVIALQKYGATCINFAFLA
jgi:hypothetical protein